MNTLTPFLFENQHLVRSVMQENQPWFIGNDVCNVLGLTNSRQVLSRLDDDEKGVHIVDTLGGLQEMTVINEAGLYSLTFTSRKQEAKRFKKWVTSEVLPSIRKTGQYGADLRAPNLIAKQNQVVKFLDKLKVERNPVMRRSLHAMLDQVCKEINIETPCLGDLGRDALLVGEITTPFWSALERLDELSIKFNHSKNDTLFAVNLPELKKLFLENNITVPMDTAIRKALKQSEHPKFVAIKIVKSQFSHTNISCWVFEHESL